MGNRALIATKDRDIFVYVHWNGGKASVKAFLDYCKAKKHRCPETDPYGWARLCQVIGNFFGGTNSVGIGTYDGCEADGDNGVYIIENWEIVGREGDREEKEEWNYVKYSGMMHEINGRMPEAERLSPEEMKAAIESGWGE